MKHKPSRQTTRAVVAIVATRSTAVSNQPHPLFFYIAHARMCLMRLTKLTRFPLALKEHARLFFITCFMFFVAKVIELVAINNK